MSVLIEREFKTLISEDQALAIQSSFDFAPPFIQTNTYFDTKKHQLAAANNALRIRTFTDHAEQTLKVRTSEAAERQIIEYTDQLPLNEAQAAVASGHPAKKGSVASQLRSMNFDLKDLHAFASMKTTRQECKISDGKLVLDHSEYEDGAADWELEMEYPDLTAARKQFKAICAQFNIKRQPVQNKIGRASEHHVKSR